jgi:hypothetical protein
MRRCGLSSAGSTAPGGVAPGASRTSVSSTRAQVSARRRGPPTSRSGLALDRPASGDESVEEVAQGDRQVGRPAEAHPLPRVAYLRGAAAQPSLPALFSLGATRPSCSSSSPDRPLWRGSQSGRGGTCIDLLRGAGPASYWRLARWAPLLFVPIFVASLIVFACVTDPSTRDRSTNLVVSSARMRSRRRRRSRAAGYCAASASPMRTSCRVAPPKVMLSWRAHR